MKKALLVVAALALTGCATYSRTVDTISGVAKATAASVDILKGPAEDVGKVWEGAFPAKGDAASEPVK